MKIAAEQNSAPSSSADSTSGTTVGIAAVTPRSTSPKLKNMRPNYFISLPIKNENIKGAIKIFEEFYKKNDPRNSSGLTGYQKVSPYRIRVHQT